MNNLGTVLICAAGILGGGSISAAFANTSTSMQLEFRVGSHRISQLNKRELEAFISQAGMHGEIRKIQIAAWSDRESPQNGATLTEAQMVLADKRAEVVEIFIEDKFDVSYISTVNMAEPRNFVGRTHGTFAALTEDSPDSIGELSANNEQASLFNLKNKASRVLVLVHYK